MPATEPLEQFSALTQRWFGGAFRAPTPAQEPASDVIADAEPALVIAPTVSAKMLAAFHRASRPASRPRCGGYLPDRRAGWFAGAADPGRRAVRGHPASPGSTRRRLWRNRTILNAAGIDEQKWRQRWVAAHPF